MLLLPPTFAWFLLLFLPTSSSSASSSPTCLPLCCDDAELGANGSDACAAVAMVDGSSMSGADVCTAGFYSADGFRPMRAPPRCSGEATPREVGLEKAPKQLRGRMITKSLYEIQLSPSRGYISTFYNAMPSSSSSSSSLLPPPPYPIPKSFCPTAVDDRGRVTRALVCPRTTLKSTKLTKCCPFGHELVFPISSSSGGRCARLTGVPPQGSGERRGRARGDRRRWYLRLDGRRVALQALVRFPYVDVLHQPARVPWKCREEEEAMAVDYEAFQFNKKGELTFTRLLGGSGVVRDFCVDSISAPDSVPVHPGETTAPGQYRSRRFLMAALYCVPVSALRGSSALLEEDVWVGSSSSSSPLESISLKSHFRVLSVSLLLALI